ncbi:hypothetical protein ACFOHS_06170 [Jhaorihella thermophila]
MLAAGTLTRPIDIFDLILHAAPLGAAAGQDGPVSHDRKPRLSAESRQKSRKRSS